MLALANLVLLGLAALIFSDGIFLSLFYVNLAIFIVYIVVMYRKGV
jgi:hypothetical protein